MLLDNYLKLKQETLLLILLIIFSFLVRIHIIIIFGDAAIENEWESLLYNLVDNKTLSFEQFDSLVRQILDKVLSIFIQQILEQRHACLFFGV